MVPKKVQPKASFSESTAGEWFWWYFYNGLIASRKSRGGYDRPNTKAIYNCYCNRTAPFDFIWHGDRKSMDITILRDSKNNRVIKSPQMFPENVPLNEGSAFDLTNLRDPIYKCTWSSNSLFILECLKEYPFPAEDYPIWPCIYFDRYRESRKCGPMCRRWFDCQWRNPTAKGDDQSL